MSPTQNPSEEPTRQVRRPAPQQTDPAATMPMPPEPENIDELLADSLKAQSEQDFTWKEPEKKPRWWQRAEAEQGTGVGAEAGDSGGALSTAQHSAPMTAPASSSSQKSGPRLGQLVFAAMCLILALWTVMTVLFGVFLDPLVVALGVCTLGGVALVVGGLLPRSGQRI